jgi:hypothetical protein
MTNKQIDNDDKKEANNTRLSPKEIDEKILTTLAQKPVGVRGLSKETGIDPTVVLRHVHALEENLLIRALSPGEYRAYGISPHFNEKPYTLMKGEVRSAMWRRVMAEIDRYLKEGDVDIEPVLAEFLHLQGGMEPVFQYWKLCDSEDDLMTLMELAISMNKPGPGKKPAEVQFDLSDFICRAAMASKDKVPRELVRKINEAIDGILNSIRNDPSEIGILLGIFHRYFILAMMGGSPLSMKRIDALIELARDHGVLIAGTVRDLYNASEQFRIIIKNNRGYFMAREWHSKDPEQKKIIRQIRALAEQAAGEDPMDHQ